jgi:hypothetical protein
LRFLKITLREVNIGRAGHRKTGGFNHLNSGICAFALTLGGNDTGRDRGPCCAGSMNENGTVGGIRGVANAPDIVRRNGVLRPRNAFVVNIAAG